MHETNDMDAYHDEGTIIWVHTGVNGLCRLCGKTNEYLIPILEDDNPDNQLKAKIEKHLSIKVTQNDTLPKHACYQCASTVIAWDDLVLKCTIANQKFLDLEQGGSCQMQEIVKEDAEIGPIYGDETLQMSTEVVESIVPGVVSSVKSISADVVSQPPKITATSTPERIQGEFPNVDEPIKNEDTSARVKEDQLFEEKGTKKKKRKKKEKISKCSICGKVFHFVEYLKSHLLVHSDKRPYLCHICGASFKRKDHANHHRRTVHITHPDIIRELGEKGEEPVVCDECGEVKPTRHAMYLHKKKHSMSCVCDLCGAHFNLPSLLKSHMLGVHTEESCQCNICGELLKSGLALYLHKQKHSISFICDVCDKSFTQPSALRTHMVVHSDEKPYKCDECGKAFKLKVRLKLHKQSHRDLRPYACTICEDKRFKTKTALTVHNNMHTDTRRYPCPHCSFRARKNSDLVCHIRTHTGEKPYKCQLCGRGFAQAGDMRKHRNTHNRQKMPC